MAALSAEAQVVDSQEDWQQIVQQADGCEVKKGIVAPLKGDAAFPARRQAFKETPKRISRIVLKQPAAWANWESGTGSRPIDRDVSAVFACRFPSPVVDYARC